MDKQPAEPIRPGDVIDVRAGPTGPSRRGVVMQVRDDPEAPAYEVAWGDGTVTRLYVSDRLITVIEPGTKSRGRADADGA